MRNRNKIMKKIFIITVLIISLFTSTSCQNWNDFIDNITNNESRALIIEGPTEVSIGKEITFIAYQGSNSNVVDADWTSSDERIAIISNNGVLKGLKIGKVEITASFINEKGKQINSSIKITIVRKILGISINDELAPIKIITEKFDYIEIGEIKKLSLSTLPENANHNINIKVLTGSEFINIDANNNITGIKEGNVIIKVSSILNTNVFQELAFDVREKEIPIDLQSQVKKVISECSNSVLGVGNYIYYNKDNLILNSLGSGFVYKQEKISDNLYGYYLITNRHVVIDNDQLKIYIFALDEEVEAMLIQYDNKVDLAIVYFECNLDIKPLRFADSDILESGTFALAIGNPEGFEFSSSATFGIISYPKRFMSDDTDGDEIVDWDAEYIQHDVAINPGNSGGPLLNMYGQVIGINSLKFATEDIDNMGFSIPSRVVIDLIPILENKEIPKRITLGIEVVSISYINNYGNSGYIVPEGLEEGLLINNVEKGSIAEKSGIQKGDVIIEFMNKKIRKTEELRALLGTIITDSNEEIEVTINRDGEVIRLILIIK